MMKMKFKLFKTFSKNQSKKGEKEIDGITALKLVIFSFVTFFFLIFLYEVHTILFVLLLFFTDLSYGFARFIAFVGYFVEVVLIYKGFVRLANKIIK